ncbi:hypothetical protein JCM11491_006989 [Sporobolomyces phaffii]
MPNFSRHSPASDPLDSDDSLPDDTETTLKTSSKSYFVKKQVKNSQPAQGAGEQQSKDKGKNKINAREVLILSSDDDADDDETRVRPRYGSPPQFATVKQEIDEDAFVKAYDEIRKALGDDLGPAEVMVAYKQGRQDVKATMKLLEQKTRKKKDAVAGRKEGADKGKGKAVEKAEPKRKKRPAPPVDEDDQEVDELASDPEDDGVKDMDWWLNIAKRDQARNKMDSELVETYKIAALDQLMSDWQKVHVRQIASVFESVSSFYAPAWFELLKIKRAGHVVAIKTARNIEYKHQQQIDPATGLKVQVKVKRGRPEESRTLEAEKKWLVGFKNGGFGKGKGKGKTFEIPEFEKVDTATPSQPRKKAAADGLSTSKSKSKSSKKAKSNDQPASSAEEMEMGSSDGWGIGGGALATANSYSSSGKKKRRHEGPVRFQVYHGGKQVDKKAKESTVAFAGKGRTLG